MRYEHLYGIEKMRETVRSVNKVDYLLDTKMTGTEKLYLKDKKDEERFILMVLDRLKANNPMTVNDMRHAIKAIEDEKGADTELPQRTYMRCIKRELYKPIFHSDKITIRLDKIELKVREDFKMKVDKVKSAKWLKPKNEKLRKALEKTKKSMIKEAEAAKEIAIVRKIRHSTVILKPSPKSYVEPAVSRWKPYNKVCEKPITKIIYDEKHSSARAGITIKKIERVQNDARILIPQQSATTSKLKYKTDECDIPDDFLRIYHHFYGQEVSGKISLDFD